MLSVVNGRQWSSTLICDGTDDGCVIQPSIGVAARPVGPLLTRIRGVAMVPVECIARNISYLKSLFSSISLDAAAVLLHSLPVNRNTIAIFLLFPGERMELVMVFAHYDS